MLRISFQTLRARRTTLAGAFVAIWLAVTLAYAAGLLLTGALGAPGSGRFAAADAVLRAEPAVELGHDLDAIDAIPGPRLDADLVARAAAVPGVARAIGDVSFRVGAWDRRGHPLRASRLHGHDWSAAALAPYALRGGAAPEHPMDVVADVRLGLQVGDKIRIAAPAGEGTYEVTGVAAARPLKDGGQTPLFFAPGVAQRLAGTPGRVNAIGIIAAPGTSPEALRARLRARIGADAEVLGPERATEADPGDPLPVKRETIVALFGTMGGIAGAVALFVVAGTFALAITQRRRETAVLRALGATPRQVRRLIAGEALIVSALASALGVVAGGPLADTIARVLIDHDAVPTGFAPGHSWVPLAAALGMGIGIAQLAVVAAARRAGRTRPAEALREVAVEHARPSVVQLLSGLLCLGGGVTMALVFSGMWAQAFAILGGLLLATGTGLLGRVLLGVPSAALAWPLRAFGASGMLASANLAANRWRTAALATPLVLIAMLAGTQGLVQTSDERNTEQVTAARVTAGHVVVGRDGAPLPAGAAAAVAGLDGVDGVAAVLPTEVYGLDHGLGEQSPWQAAGVSVAGSEPALDPRVVEGDLTAVRGHGVAVSRVVAHDGRLELGDVIRVRMADLAPQSLRVAAVFERAAGLGDVLLDPALARRHASVAADSAVFVAGGPEAGRSLRRYAAKRPGLAVQTRAEHLDTVHATGQGDAWGIWLIVGLASLFAALALVNTAAMATAERRGELATIRLLGGTSAHVVRMIVLELVPTVLVALAAGGAIVAVTVAGVSRGVTGIPLEIPAPLIGGLVGGTALLALMAGLVTARLALRASAAEAMRGAE